MGTITYRGLFGVPADEESADRYWKKEYDLLSGGATSSPRSMHMLAHMYQRGIVSDAENSLALFADSANAGFAPSFWSIAQLMRYCKIKHLDEAVEPTVIPFAADATGVDILGEAAARRYPKALGRYEPEDAGIEGKKLAGLYGDPVALRELGLNSLASSSGPSDDVIGLTFLRLSSELGDAEAPKLYSKFAANVEPSVVLSADTAANAWQTIPYPIDMWTIHSGFSPAGWQPMVQPVYMIQEEDLCSLSQR